MNRSKAWSYLAGIAVTGTLVAGAAAQTSEPRARPLLVGVVDLGAVFERYQRTAEVVRQIDDEKERMGAMAKEQRRSIENLRKELDATPEASAAYRDKAAELRLVQKGVEAMEAETAAIAEKRFEALTLQVIDEIEDGVRQFAKTGKYDMILKTTTKGWGDKRLPERIYRAQISTVVAYDPKLDVTEAIIARLNEPESPKKRDAR